MTKDSFIRNSELRGVGGAVIPVYVCGSSEIQIGEVKLKK